MTCKYKKTVMEGVKNINKTSAEAILHYHWCWHIVICLQTVNKAYSLDELSLQNGKIKKNMMKYVQKCLQISSRLFKNIPKIETLIYLYVWLVF